MTFPNRGAIDTNVLIVANGRDTNAKPQCIANSAKFLSDATRSYTVLLDSTWIILNEYKHKCNQTGQPGVGDRFLLHLLRTQADSRHVHLVRITATDDGSFLEVPESLRTFDRNDHKFIATVLADGCGAPIVNSTDSDWANDKSALEEAGINVYQLCTDSQEKKNRESNRTRKSSS